MQISNFNPKFTDNHPLYVQEKPLDSALATFIKKCEAGQKTKLTNNIITKIKESKIKNEALLKWSIKKNHPELSATLIKNGTLENLSAEGKYHLAFLAIESKQLSTVNLMIESHQINLQSLISYAASTRNTHILDFMEAQGANFEACVPGVLHFLSMAENFPANKNEEEWLEKFIARQLHLVDQKDRDGRPPLFWAVNYGRAQLAHHLIKAGANINNTDAQGNSAILIACSLRNTDFIDLLMENNAKADASMSSAGGLLHALISFGFPKDVKEQKWLDALLIHHPEIAVQRDQHDVTPMQKAALEGNILLINLLAAHNVEMDDLSAILLEGLKNPVSGEYEDLKTRIDQDHIITQIQTYLELKMQAEPEAYTKIQITGLCKGLSYLFGYYCSRGKKDEFFESLKEISQWDGTVESLQEVPDSSVVAKVYESKDKVFLHWINDMVFLQSKDLITLPTWKSLFNILYDQVLFKGFEGHPSQTLLAAKHEIIQKDDHRQPIRHRPYRLFSQKDLKKKMEDQINMEKVMHLSVKVGEIQHGVAIHIKDEHISFYDSNLRFEFPTSTSIEKASAVLMEYFKVRYELGTQGNKEIYGATYNFSI